MLPGWVWGNWVEEHTGAFIVDENHDNEHAQVTVTDISIDNEDVATVEKGGSGWNIEAVSHGNATVTITFTDIDGTEGCTWIVPISVSSDVYNVDVQVASGDTWALPGETVPLVANGWHEFENADGSQDSTEEGLAYQWFVDDAQDVATIEPSADGKSATVTFNERPDDEEHWQRDIWVRVVLYDNDEHGQPQEVAENGVNLVVCDAYYVIMPYEPDFPSDTAVGETITVSPKLLLRRAIDDEADLTSEAQFEIHYDPQVIRVSGATATDEDENPAGSLRIDGGESFEITRLRDRSTDIQIDAFWTDENGQDRTDNRVYCLDYMPHTCVGNVFLKIEAKAPTLDYEGWIEHWRCYSFQPSNPSCQGYFLGDKKHEQVAPEVVTIPRLIDIKDASVSGIADKTYNGSEFTQGPIVKMDEITLVKGTDYTVSGSLKATNTGSCTITTTGIGIYGGTKTVSYTIAKAPISRATIAPMADQGYTGSAIKPAPVVKMGSTTLRSGTDYTVGYRYNTNVGTATVTVTGKGNYTGTKGASFKIVNWSGASRIPVSARATYTLLRGGYMRVKSGSRKATSNAHVSISGATITGKKVGKTTVYLYNSKGRQIATKTVEVYAAHGRTYELESSVDWHYLLDIHSASTSNGAQMIVWRRKTSGNVKNQRYTLYLQPDGTYTVKSVNSGKYLTAESKTNKYVQQWAWKGGNDQRWRLTVDAGNRVTFVNVKTNKCFDVQGGSTTNGAKMIVWRYNGGLNQKWKLNQK